MKPYIYTSVLLAALLLQACYKDEGNYNYTDINEVAISGFEQEPLSVTDNVPLYESLDGTLTLTPVFSSTMPENEADYTYEWTAIRPYGSDQTLHTIARTRNLENHPLGLTANTYPVYYRITDQRTGVMFQYTFQIRVQTNISTGYIVMNDINGAMRLDMLSYYGSEYHYLEDVLARQGAAVPPMANPVKVVSFNKMNFLGGALNIFLLGASAAHRINYGTFAYMPDNGIPNCFLHPSYCPPDFVAKNIGVSPGNMVSTLLLGNNGKLYNYAVFATMTPWSVPVNTIDGVNTFTVSPHFAADNQMMQGYWVVFDEDAKSFYRLPSYAATPAYNPHRCSPLPAGTLTPYVNMNKDLVYIANPGTAWYAIMKDTANDYWFLRFTSTMFGNGGFVQNKWQKMNATGIQQANLFSVIPLYPNNLYYAVGGKVYAYNIEEDQSYEMLDTSPAQVTFMDRDLPSNDMMVASYDAASQTGTLVSYGIDPLPAPFNVKQEFEGTAFGKIVSIIKK